MAHAQVYCVRCRANLDTKGLILALVLRQTSIKCFELFPLRLDADTSIAGDVERKTCAPPHAPQPANFDFSVVPHRIFTLRYRC